jgi:hypothetical protein
MSTSITTAFVAQYEKEANDQFQRYGGMLRSAVRTRENVVGSTCTFQKIGTGAASTKARHGVITPMNVAHTAPAATLADFYAGDWVDRLDEAKIAHDERAALARAGAYALGRKVDEQILTALDTTSQSTVSVSLTGTSQFLSSMLEWSRALDRNDVPNDGQRYAAISPFCWSCLSKVTAFASADYVGANGLPLTTGASIMKWKPWNGVLWAVHNGLTGVGTATSVMFMWHKNAIGYATGAVPKNMGDAGYPSPVQADITWHGDRAAHFINHWMSGGAVLIDDTGVIQANIDDTGTVPISSS